MRVLWFSFDLDLALLVKGREWQAVSDKAKRQWYTTHPEQNGLHWCVSGMADSREGVPCLCRCGSTAPQNLGCHKLTWTCRNDLDSEKHLHPGAHRAWWLGSTIALWLVLYPSSPGIHWKEVNEVSSPQDCKAQLHVRSFFSTLGPFLTLLHF